MYNLLGHMHLHAGSKPFKCPYCSSKFNLKGNLSRHMKVKHGVMDISLDSQGRCRWGWRLWPVAGPAHCRLGAAVSLGVLRAPGCATAPLGSTRWVLRWGGCRRAMRGAPAPWGRADTMRCPLDPMMDLAGAEHAELDGQQEMEDFEEENSYGYGGVGNPPDESALAEQAMKEMAYYNML